MDCFTNRQHGYMCSRAGNDVLPHFPQFSRVHSDGCVRAPAVSWLYYVEQMTLCFCTDLDSSSSPMNWSSIDWAAGIWARRFWKCECWPWRDLRSDGGARAGADSGKFGYVSSCLIWNHIITSARCNSASIGPNSAITKACNGTRNFGDECNFSKSRCSTRVPGSQVRTFQTRSSELFTRFASFPLLCHLTMI